MAITGTGQTDKKAILNHALAGDEDALARIVNPPGSAGVGESTDHALARFDGTDGALQDSGVLVDDSDNMSGIGTLGTTGDVTSGGSVASTDEVSPGTWLEFGTATELTVATGAVTATRMSHTVDTESDAATDDLDTISGNAPGRFLLLKAQDVARVVTVKHGTGNLTLTGAADFALNEAADQILLLGTSSGWVEVMRFSTT